jgi:hypothetical protein
MYCITDRSGKRYYVNDRSEITQTHINTFPGKWKLRGFVKIDNFGHFVEQISFPNFPPKNDLLYKNGKPKWRVVDLDHGTTRTWGAGLVAYWETAK